MKKLKLAVIGCGGMEKTHESGFAGLDSVEVVCTADIIRERAEIAAGVYGAQYAYTDYRDTFDKADACLLVLPHHLHYPIGRDCLLAGKHVLMEKPFCNTEEQCRELIDIAAQKQLTLMTAYCMRFHPMVVRLKELLDAKTYGDVFQLSIWTEQLTMVKSDDWGGLAATLGGGQLFSHGCHYIDLLLWYLGRPVKGTHTGTKYGTPWMDMEGTSNVAIEFENGALGYHFGTWGARGSRLKYSIHAHCTEGMLEAALSEGKLILHRFGRGEELLFRYNSGKHT
ncbi:MAG: Gfo/Idh/MocA family oxidoreductase, partial [Eubacteriales bacterium]|nr:Gfo/Idh/MocA family oxidoreductase [Eubacteriales bacterium]